MVKEVQEDLADLGFYDGPINGVYGPRTTAAVKRFQARTGLPVDGIAGPQTMGAINLALGNDSNDAVDLLQTTLKGLCYYGGNVDGIFGSGTEAALIAFQKAEGLNADGRYGPKTAVALAKAWPGRPSSCSGTTPSGAGPATTSGRPLNSAAAARCRNTGPHARTKIGARGSPPASLRRQRRAPTHRLAPGRVACPNR